VAANGTECPTSGDAKCTSCDSGYSLENSICVLKQSVVLFSKGSPYCDSAVASANKCGAYDSSANVHSFDSFNQIARLSGVVTRECLNCASSHQFIVYKRLTHVETFNYGWILLHSWMTRDACQSAPCQPNNGLPNWLNTDFELYSSLEDAKHGRNKWTHCNYNDGGVAFPRDCGPSSTFGSCSSCYHHHQWNSLTRGGQSRIRFTMEYLD